MASPKDSVKLNCQAISHDMRDRLHGKKLKRPAGYQIIRTRDVRDCFLWRNRTIVNAAAHASAKAIYTKSESTDRLHHSTVVFRGREIA